jgi:thioredoxin 1
MEELNESNFEEKTKEGLVVVDFWADWCGPCKMFSPIVESVSRSFPQAKFFKFDVEESKNLSIHLEVRSIPTTIVYKDGKETKRFIGFRHQTVLQEELSKALVLDV